MTMRRVSCIVLQLPMVQQLPSTTGITSTPAHRHEPHLYPLGARPRRQNHHPLVTMTMTMVMVMAMAITMTMAMAMAIA